MLGIFLDQETTGLDPYRHKLLEIALKVVDLSSGKVLRAFDAVISQPEEAFRASDSKALEVNGFSWEEVGRGKTEKEAKDAIIELFKELQIVRGKAVFICQNPSFDRAFFSHLVDCYLQEKMLWPYHWLDLASMYWALEVHKIKGLDGKMPDEIWLSKDHIAKSIGLDKESNPHRAMQGVDHLLQCYTKIVGFTCR